MKIRVATIALLTISAFSIGIYIVTRTTTTWYGYEIRFASAPPDDAKLEDWLKTQDGISIARIERTNRQSIEIIFEYTGNPLMRPRAYNILKACKAMGYNDLVIIDSEVSPGR